MLASRLNRRAAEKEDLIASRPSFTKFSQNSKLLLEAGHYSNVLLIYSIHDSKNFINSSELFYNGGML